MRVLTRVGASLLILIGVVAIVTAIVTMKVVGKDNTILMDPKTISTKGSAVTTGRGLLSLYNTTLQVDVTTKDPHELVWIGIAHQDDLTNYLSDKSRAEIISYQYPDRIGINNYKGTDNDLAAPTGLDWWVASAKGTGHAELSWPMQNAPYGAVIMNQDGARKFAGDVRLGLQIKGVFETAEWAGIGGLIAVLLGIGIFIATRTRQRRIEPESDPEPPSRDQQLHQPTAAPAADKSQQSTNPIPSPEADR